MTDHPIAPDLTGDVPRCQASCPSATLYEDSPWHSHCAEQARRVILHGTICLPHVRHLKLLSERRCDGCASWTGRSPRTGWCALKAYGRDADDPCSRWSPKQQTNQNPAAVSDGEKRSEDG